MEKQKNTTRWVVFSILAEDEGFDLIKVRLRRAVAGGAHPRRIEFGSNPYPCNHNH